MKRKITKRMVRGRRGILLTSSTPRSVQLGSRDLSIPPQIQENLSLPQHIPIYYIFAEKGPRE